MSMPHLPLVQSYHPTTFLERGVAVPFTTPMLAGARARPADRGGAELVVPSPSGGRGTYVLAWSGVRELCQPTVHDTRLNKKVAELAHVTPSAIRRAAHEVATEGLAGREVIAAAEAAREADYQDRLVTNFMLLATLLEQVDPSGGKPVSATGRVDTALESRARQIIDQIAPRLGRSGDNIATSLEDLAPLFAGIGVARNPSGGRAARALGGLRAVRGAMTEWSLGHDDESGAQAEMIGRVADVTISCTGAVLGDVQGLTADMLGLLARWWSEPMLIGQLTARPEWLLDGWEQLCLLWNTAESDSGRRAVLPEMALQVPIVPREVSDWVGMQIDMDGAMQFRRSVSLNEDWRTGSAVFDLVARNEQFRALAA